MNDKEPQFILQEGENLKIGSGINRIKKFVNERGLKVKFEIDDFFRIIFFRSTTPKTTPKKIIMLIENNPRITKEELAKSLGITADGVKYHLKKMRGIIKWVGPTKGGHWELKEKP